MQSTKEIFLAFPLLTKKVVLEIIDIVRLHDGKFVEHWNVLDWQNVLTQSTAQ